MKVFVSAGWPYLYDIPGLHNCVPMLFADVAARFHRLHGDDVFFLCGSDDHGARIEFVSEGYGKKPADLVREKYEATLPLLGRLGLSFDLFGRTSDERHRAFVQGFYARLRSRGALSAREESIPFCERCSKFLPDRFLEGKCPHCGGRAYGNQCQNKKSCDRLLKPSELVEAHCAACGDVAGFRKSKHWIFSVGQHAEAATTQVTSTAAFQDEVKAIVHRTLREVPEMVVTRNVTWGIPLPWEDPGITAYNWVDSLLAKVSFTPEPFFKDPSAKKMFFLGKDSVPFYGVLFPALLSAADMGHSLNEWWVVPNEVFIYEGGVCSKSTGTGIWLREALAVLPGDYWRFYIFYAYARRNQVERDVDFRWERFAKAVNEELMAPLSQAVAEPGDDKATGLVDEAKDLLAQGRIGRALATLLELVRRRPSRQVLHTALPLLSCYIPETAARAAACLTTGESLFPDGPVDARSVQRRYQREVEVRRGERTLEEEITDARADGLCVCPINLSEG
ncbi:MAG: class I tRNA ligase family protein [Deltaproteobacteria bacterium]|nr:class I tRNA ligase family protein [Deltaproteobacteria bacterium]